MRWAVCGGGYCSCTNYTADVIFAQCNSFQNARKLYSESDINKVLEVSFTYARLGMRCRALSYWDCLNQSNLLDAKAICDKLFKPKMGSRFLLIVK